MNSYQFTPNHVLYCTKLNVKVIHQQKIKKKEQICYGNLYQLIKNH